MRNSHAWVRFIENICRIGNKGDMSLTKNIAVVGCGYWGKNLLRNFNELNALYAICDTDEDKLGFFGKEYPEVLKHKNYEDLLSDPGVEAVVISTPAATHYSLVKKALSAEKNAPSAKM